MSPTTFLRARVSNTCTWRPELASRSGQIPDCSRLPLLSPNDLALGLGPASQSGRRLACFRSARFFPSDLARELRLKDKAGPGATNKPRFPTNHVTATTFRESAPSTRPYPNRYHPRPSGKHVGVFLTLSFLPHVSIPFLDSLFGPRLPLLPVQHKETILLPIP